MSGEGIAPGRSLLLTPASPPAGPHVRHPLLHPLPGQLLHHPPCHAPEDSEQEQGHEGELKRGSVGAWTVSPHRLHPLFPPPQFHPDSGVSPHSLEARVWDRAWGLLLDSPCAHHGAGSVLESLAWSQEHPAPPVLAAFHIQTAGCSGQPLPSLLLGCSLDVHWVRAVSRDCLTQLLGCCRLPLSPRQPCTQGSPRVLRGSLVTPSTALDSRGAPAPPSPSIHREGAAGAREEWEQQEPGPGLTLELCKQHPGLARVKIKGRSCPGVLGQSGNSFHTLWLWFIWKWVLTQPP